MNTVVFQTERLTLRTLAETDCNNIRYLLKPEIEKFSGPYMPHNENQLKQHISKIIGNFTWGVLLKDNTFIGDISVTSVIDNKIGEISWYFDPVYWNKGYATEAAISIISHMFNTQFLLRLSAQIDAKNIASRKLAEKLGFELNAILPQANFYGKVADIAYYSLPNPHIK